MIEFEKQFSLLIQKVTQAGIYLLNRDGHILTWNKGASQILRYSHQEIIGQHFSLLYSHDAKAAGRPSHHLQIAVQKGYYQNDEWRIRSDKSRFWAQTAIVPMSDEEGQLIGFLEIITDLDACRQEQQPLSFIIEGALAGIMLFEPVFTTANQITDFTCRVVNWTQDTVAGRSIKEVQEQSLKSLFPTIQDQLFWQQLVDCYQTDRLKKHLEYYVWDGNDTWIDGTFFKQGTGVLWVFQDVTKLKQSQSELKSTILNLQKEIQQAQINPGRLKIAEQEISRAQESEHEMNVLKADFVKLVSHQFRTPMTSILLQAEILKKYSERSTDSDFAHRVFDYSEKVVQDINRLDKLITKILTHDNINTKPIDIKIEFVDLVELCHTLIQQQQQRHDLNYGRVLLGAKQPKVLVEADHILLEQVIENLINNALKYSTYSEKPVEIIIKQTRSGGCISIKDYGIGIPADEIKYLTKSFFRASNSTEYPGTGLGLSLSHKIVTLHGGTLTIESKQNHYTTITINLPRHLRCNLPQKTD